MYKMARGKDWTIASVREHLATVIRSAAREPQRIYRRRTLVATVVGPDAAAELEASARRPRLAAAFAELQQICADADYVLEPPTRRDRANPIARAKRHRR